MVKQQETLEIEDLRVLEVLNNSTRLRMLAQMVQPISVKELAAAMDVPVTRLYYHIKALEGVGVIRVADTRKVGPMVEKRYQVVATQFKASPKIAEGVEDFVWAAGVIAGTVLDGARLDAVRSLSGHLADVSAGTPFEAIVGTLGRSVGSMTREQALEFGERLEQLAYEMSDGEIDNGVDFAFSFVFFPMASPIRGVSS